MTIDLPPAVPCACEACGAAFTAKRYEVRRGRARYCSPACQHASRPRRPLADRLWERVDKNGPIPAHRPELGPCWVWTGRSKIQGYGVLGGGGASDKGAGNLRAHRAAWMLTYGPIPAGLFVCHACDNPPCCNPAHLFLDTNEGNARDMSRKGRAFAQRHPERATRGERSGRATLTWEIARAVRRRYVPRVVTAAMLAREYGVGVAAVEQILAGNTWITDDEA